LYFNKLNNLAIINPNRVPRLKHPHNNLIINNLTIILKKNKLLRSVETLYTETQKTNLTA